MKKWKVQKQGAFEKVEAFIRKTLVPVANKVDSNAYLTAIKKEWS